MNYRFRAPLLFVLIAAVFAGCVAESVERRRPRKGPVEAVGYVDAGGGRVRYSVEGWDWFVAGRRRHALRLMRRNCGRDLEPRVTDEYVKEDADAAYSGEDVTASLAHGGEHFHVEKYDHMAYECRPAGWKEPAVSSAPARAPMVIPPMMSSGTVTVSTGTTP